MELTIDQALQKAVEAHKAGQVQEADRLYTAILQAQPKHPDANHNLGVLAVGIGKVEEALPFLKTALEANSRITQFWLSYIDTLIRLDRIAEARAMLDEAKSQSAKGDEFDKLEMRITEADQVPLEANQIAVISQNKHHNTLVSLKVEKAIKFTNNKERSGAPKEAERKNKGDLSKLPENTMAKDGPKGQTNNSTDKISKIQNPSQDQIRSLINLYTKGEIEQAIHQANTLLKEFPNSATLFNIQGALLKAQGQLDLSIDVYKKALAIKPDYAEVYNNLGIVLKEQGKLQKAIETYKKALNIKPDYAEAYTNIGNALMKLGKLDEAIGTYKKALAIKPDYAEAYYNIGNALTVKEKLHEAITAYKKAIDIKPDYRQAYYNMGNALKEQGTLEEAIDAYEKAIDIKPDYAEAYYNIGITLQEQGKPDEAIAAYNKVLSVKPDYVEAHRNLSTLVKYQPDDAQIALVSAMMRRPDLKDGDRCHLHYTIAKMNEDLGDLGAAYENYVTGGKLRQKLLSYNFKQDKLFFDQIKKTAPKLKECTFNEPIKAANNTPIFILGMPRSGTTLVEQIISSHSKVHGAGELPFLNRFGASTGIGDQIICSENILQIRNAYLHQLEKLSKGRRFVTDKMPQNFMFLGLLSKALPEAKIVHLKRDPAATCWSNFKHYFILNGLGYSYNLKDTVNYYKLYVNLMEFWDQQYGEQIYHLDYDKLTLKQESETRKLIEYLELDWEDTCLSPQDNKRNLRTASQQQVRQKVYTGSSQAWHKFEPYLNGVFDELYDL